MKCLIRNHQVADLPEEKVRQHLLHLMVDRLGYPKSHIAVECSLNQIPHLFQNKNSLPERRADILCFAKDRPLLLIECKAIKLTKYVFQQVAGYNSYIQAPFFAIANQEEIQTWWLDKKSNSFKSIDFLPPYEELLSAIS